MKTRLEKQIENKNFWTKDKQKRKFLDNKIMKRPNPKNFWQKDKQNESLFDNKLFEETNPTLANSLHYTI